MPAGPPPTIATRSCRRVFGGWIAGSFPCSAAKRLSERIATGSSSVPLRHADSHGAVQIHPQTDGNGFTSAATAYASSYRPCAIRPTYRPASVPAGHAFWHGARGSRRSSTMVRHACHGWGRSLVRHVKSGANGSGWSGLSDSRVTSDSGIHPLDWAAATGLVRDPAARPAACRRRPCRASRPGRGTRARRSRSRCTRRPASGTPSSSAGGPPLESRSRCHRARGVSCPAPARGTRPCTRRS